MSTIYQIQNATFQPVGNVLCLRLPDFPEPQWYVSFSHAYHVPGQLCASLDDVQVLCQRVMGKGQGRLVAKPTPLDNVAKRRQSDLQAIAATLEHLLKDRVAPPKPAMIAAPSLPTNVIPIRQEEAA